MRVVAIDIDCKVVSAGPEDMQVTISLRLPTSELPAFQAAFHLALVQWAESRGGACTTETITTGNSKLVC
jgi:hypothetical protein